MKRETLWALFGTLFGLAAGVLGVLYLGPDRAKPSSGDEAAQVRAERDAANEELARVRGKLADAAKETERLGTISRELSDELAKRDTKGSDTASGEWKTRHDELKTSTDEALLQKDARLKRLEELLDKHDITEHLTDEEIAARVQAYSTEFETAFAGGDKRKTLEALWQVQALGPRAYADAIKLWEKVAADFGLDPWGQGPNKLGLRFEDYTTLISEWGMVEMGLTSREVPGSFRIASIYAAPWWSSQPEGDRARLIGDVLLRSKGYEATAAISALGQINDPAATRYLGDYVAGDTEDPDARKAALNLLAQKDTPEAWAAIASAAANDADEGVRRHAQGLIDRRDTPVTVAGVLVTSVNSSLQGALAGIKINDIVTHFNGVRILTIEELIRERNKVAPGENATITVRRGTEDLTLTLGAGEIGISGSNVKPKD